MLTTTTRQLLSRSSALAPMTAGRPYTRSASALPPARVVRPADEADVSKCVWTLASAFDRVPCTNAFSAESGQTVLAYVDKTIRSSLGENGVLVEAANSSAVALWELPCTYAHQEQVQGQGAQQQQQEEEENPGEGKMKRRTYGPVKEEWKRVVHRAKAKYIGTEKSTGAVRPHYHLDFLARNPAVPKIPGAISAVVLPYLARAEQDQLSVWLEATSLDVVTLYQHFGFRVLEEITVGVGRVDGSGALKRGGEGVKAWLMLVDNHESS